jgi:ribonuclease HI
VSAVPLVDYGEAALQVRLTDATWTAIRAMRHERVVEHFAKHTAVVPLRFGTIFLRRDPISRMLDDRRAELQAIIERLRGREEWGITIYRDQATLMAAITSLSPRLREMSARAAKATPGQGYLLRKEIDALRTDEARAETRRVIAEIEHELASLCDDAARLRVLKNEATEQGEVTAKMAFLISRERFGEFHTAAERLAQAYAASGFQLELTGPWPAYNFVGGLTLSEATG